MSSTQSHLFLADIPLRAERLLITKALMRMLRNRQRGEMPTTRFATSLDEMLVHMGVFIGHCEGKPFSASRLAARIEMPRPTLLRRLASLERRGLIHRRGHIYCISIAAASTDESVEATCKNIKIVNSLSRRLSEMDGPPA